MEWLVANKKADFKGIGKRFGIDQVVARIIRNRDITEDEDIRIYLDGTLDNLADPHKMKDMDHLVDILTEKIHQQAKIRIIGDYDVDGVTSSHLLRSACRRAGADVDVVIPHRVRDGYGLNIHLVKEALADHVDTILTCDNGISALDEIAYAKAHGMTVLVTDHHTVPFEETDGRHVEKHSMADAVVNPHQAECTYPYKELCGAGVAWAVIRVLYEKLDIPDAEALDLLEFVAMGTVCDVMPLTGENRILVREGLKRIRQTKNVGMRALIRAAGILQERVNVYHFGFVLGPCINATGRLDSAVRALRLFQTGDSREAEEIAQDLVGLNEERKELTKQGVEEAEKIVEQEAYDKDPVLVIYLPDVHESIAGLIAGRIREKYSRPVFVLTKSADGVKGSGRSTEEYSMYEQMCRCGELFTKFGGHPMAAGLSIREENISLFREKINELCPLTPEQMESAVHIDVPMPVDYVTMDLVRQLCILEPFGKDNECPVFADRNLQVTRMWVVGKNRNVLRLTMKSEQGKQVSVVYFGDIRQFETYLTEKFGRTALENAEKGLENPICLSMVYDPEINEYMGNESLQFVMKYYR